MTKLDCNVTGCLHNSENCCCKNVIVVEGQTAREKCDTCCGSYDENKGGMFRNMCKTPKDRFCEAEHIGITGGDTTEAQGTECSSFKAR